MSVEGRSSITNIQWLRATAASMVVVLHLALQLERLGIARMETNYLASGVDIFFVVSGFIMWVTTAQKPERTAAMFLRDRVARIAPLYWLVTALLVFIMVLFPYLVQTAVLDTSHVILSVFFLPAPNPADGSYTPPLIPGWTLNYEMFFYLLFAAALALAGRNWVLRAVLIILPIIALAVAGMMLPLEGVAMFYTRDILLEFVFGIVIGIVYMRRRERGDDRWWLSAAAGAALLAAFSWDGVVVTRALEWGVPAALIVTGCVFAKPLSFPLFERLGDWSYALYLSHPIVLSAAAQGWRLLPDSVPAALFPIAALAACLVTSAALHPFEIWAREWTKAKLGRPRDRTTVAGAAG